jgi:PKD repeat protein
VTVAPSSTPLIDAGFISGGFDLSLASALVDAGDPGALDPTDSASDVAGNPRVVSRGAGNVRDIGAYEVQNHAPVPVIAIQTSVPSTTVQTQFSAAGSSDADGDAVTYDWRFDGTSFATGVAPKKLFNTDGPHSVQLTVTDKTGAASISSTQFIVAKGHLALRLTSRNARMSSSGTFKVRISCPELAATDCTGRILFTTVKKIQANHYYVKPSKKKQAAKILSAANYVFRVQPGTTATGTVRAYRTFRNVLNKKGKLQLQTSVISGTTANAILDSNRTTFNISAPKKK